MADRSETAKRYLELSLAGDSDGVIALLTDGVVLNRPMLGAVTGKQAVAEAIRNRPMAAGALAPAFEEPVASGDTVRVKGNLPPGAPFPIPSLTWTFTFDGDQIARIDIGL
jgi:hypothetical protein